MTEEWLKDQSELFHRRTRPQHTTKIWNWKVMQNV